MAGRGSGGGEPRAALRGVAGLVRRPAILCSACLMDGFRLSRAAARTLSSVLCAGAEDVLLCANLSSEVSAVFDDVR